MQLVANGCLHYRIDASSLQLASLNDVDANLSRERERQKVQLQQRDTIQLKDMADTPPASPSLCLGDWLVQPSSDELFYVCARSKLS